jgi:hypothetical protein
MREPISSRRVAWWMSRSTERESATVAASELPERLRLQVEALKHEAQHRSYLRGQHADNLQRNAALFLLLLQRKLVSLSFSQYRAVAASNAIT